MAKRKGLKDRFFYARGLCHPSAIHQSYETDNKQAAANLREEYVRKADPEGYAAYYSKEEIEHELSEIA